MAWNGHVTISTGTASGSSNKNAGRGIFPSGSIVAVSLDESRLAEFTVAIVAQPDEQIKTAAKANDVKRVMARNAAISTKKATADSRREPRNGQCQRRLAQANG